MTDKISNDILRRLGAIEERILGSGAVALDEGNDQRLPTTAVARRYLTSTRTIERWTVDPELDFPQPIYINGRKFWSLHELQMWDRQRATSR